MRAALAGDERVNLVDDDRIYSRQPLPRVRRQEEEQRLGRGDENVGGLAAESRTLERGSIARADGDLRNRDADARLARQIRDSRERRAEVALDVNRQRLQRRYVEHAAPLLGRGRGLEQQPVQAPEERCQRLPAAGRRKDERGVAARDGGPPELLRTRRRLERAGEPLPDRRAKQLEHIASRHATSKHARAPRSATRIIDE